MDILVRATFELGVDSARSQYAWKFIVLNAEIADVEEMVDKNMLEGLKNARMHRECSVVSFFSVSNEVVYK